jgi:hypothetical protein
VLFLSKGVTIADLKTTGTELSDIHKLIRVVIGGRKTSKQLFSNLVGIKSRSQEEFEEDRIAVLTSSSETVAKCDNTGGVRGGREWGDSESGLSFELRTAILSEKNSIKEVAKNLLETKEGKTEHEDRHRTEFKVDQSFFELYLELEMRLRKKLLYR